MFHAAMMIFDKARENADAVARIGLVALEEGAKIGAPIHYMDPSLGEGLIRHFPNGTRQRLVRVGGELTVTETLEPGVVVSV